MKDTTLRSAEQLGATIRLKRREKGLSQNSLAELLGVERKWVIHLEAGNPRAELGLVLKLVKALNIGISLSDQDHSLPGHSRHKPTSRLDDVFRRLQRPARK